MTGWIIQADGRGWPCSENLHKEGDSNFAALYEALDCSMVELVKFKHGEFWCDEEGLMKGRPQINGIATRIWRESLVAEGVSEEDAQGVGLVGTVFMRLRKGYVLDDSGRVAKG